MQQANDPAQRFRLIIRGAVQGVGFRPFVYRLASELGLNGWVNNSSQGVFIEVEGKHSQISEFLLRLEKEKPPRSFIQSLEASELDVIGYGQFEIRASEAAGEKTALVLPDIATCPDCRDEIFDPANRRFRYPFTNCTNCGPRFSIIEALPYDRAHTSMKGFTMCPHCQAEYDDPRDRRFHAQPNACPVCGPQLALWDKKGHTLSSGDSALLGAVDALRKGAILAVKGIGGFHLMVVASREEAVRRLRELKHREEKPLAVMFPTLEQVKEACAADPLEERLLQSPEAPIVLLRRKSRAAAQPIASAVAPGNPTLGVMLPYSPLHHLLLAELGCAVVATSGNLSDEPICIDEQEALRRLGGIADLFLAHNRPIVRHVDDSIARLMLGRELVLRRARGYAPLPIALRQPTAPLLAVGAHLKNDVALAVGKQVFISQHIGDLETETALEAFRHVIEDFERLYDTKPAAIAADLHPDYLSTQFARKSGKSVVPVQHHLAHVLSCMAENEIEPPFLGVAWDGTGFGLDGTIWGGEFFHVTENSARRAGWLRPFRLPGGEKAVREPRRVALGLLYELLGDAVFARRDLAPVRAFSGAELAMLRSVLARRINAPLTSSAGRLFDAIASLIGLRQTIHFEGQAAMELEFLLQNEESATQGRYPIELRASNDSYQVDWARMVEEILADLHNGVSAAVISGKFHDSLAEAIVAMAKKIGEPKVVLSGGCFQNRYLSEATVRRLRGEGFHPYWHQRVPPNDGGIALGQIVGAIRGLRD